MYLFLSIQAHLVTSPTYELTSSLPDPLKVESTRRGVKRPRVSENRAQQYMPRMFIPMTNSTTPQCTVASVGSTNSLDCSDASSSLREKAPAVKRLRKSVKKVKHSVELNPAPNCAYYFSLLSCSILCLVADEERILFYNIYIRHKPILSVIRTVGNFLPKNNTNNQFLLNGIWCI